MCISVSQAIVAISPFSRFVDVDPLYMSIDPGAHRRDVSVNVRVIRTFIEYGITNEKSRTHGYYYRERYNDYYLVLEPRCGTVRAGQCVFCEPFALMTWLPVCLVLIPVYRLTSIILGILGHYLPRENGCSSSM